MNRLQFLKRLGLGITGLVIAPKLIADDKISERKFIIPKLTEEQDMVWQAHEGIHRDFQRDKIEIHSIQHDELFTAHNETDSVKDVIAYVHNGEVKCFSGIELCSPNNLSAMDIKIDYGNLSQTFVPVSQYNNPNNYTFNQCTVEYGFVLVRGDTIKLRLAPKQKVIGKLLT